MAMTKYHKVDPEELLDRITQTFPKITWASYRFVEEGWDHAVVILDEKIVFRFPSDNEYKALLKPEVETLKHLLPLVTINVPNYAYVAPDVSFAGYDIVPGKTLTKALFDSLRPADQSIIAKQLAGFLSTLHTALANGHNLGEVPKPTLLEDQEEIKGHMREHLVKALSPEDLAIVKEILADVDALLSEDTPKVFIHGDMYHSHILWDETTKQVGVIDFSDRNIGDPAIDFSELYEYGDDFIAEMYSYYTGPKDDIFLQRAWTYERWTGVYMMTDHFVNHRTTFEEARELFDRVKTRRSVG